MAKQVNFSHAAFFDLSPRLKLRVTGADALRFLNGQISNDLRKATSETAVQAAVLNAKGKLNAIIFISVEADSFMLDADLEVKDELPGRIERYIVADDVQIEDVSDRFGIFHVTGEAKPPAVSPPGRTVQTVRFGRSGWDVWIESAEHDHVFQQLAPVSVFCDLECAELIRIEQGIPRWGRELSDGIIPIEANLEASTIDYAKGCYIGQEVISRIRSSGQTNKRLCGLVSLSGAPLRPGMRLTADGEDLKEAGWITSAIRSPRLEQEIGLGYLKRGFGSVGMQLRTFLPETPNRDLSVPVEVTALPFL